MHVRFLYNPKTSKRPGNTEHILDFPGMGYNQHWTRSLAWNRDGMKTVHFGRGTRSPAAVHVLRGAAVSCGLPARRVPRGERFVEPAPPERLRGGVYPV